MQPATQPAKLGLIIGNRGFFPDHLAATGREDIINVMQQAGIDVIALTPEESKFGAVETFEEAKRCADLFKKHREAIEGCPGCHHERIPGTAFQDRSG